MVLIPLEHHDPRLRQLCAPVSKPQLREHQQQLEIEALLDFVYGAVNKNVVGAARDRSKPNTAGISGSQLGIMKQLCAVDLAVGRRGYTDIHVLVNPRITWSSRAILEKAEGCVNFPTIWGITRRARSVKVKGLDRSGNDIELTVTGWPAILLQHEIDHLHGRLFIDRLVDPAHAHYVTQEDYPLYRKLKPESWKKLIDVTNDVIRLTDV